MALYTINNGSENTIVVDNLRWPNLSLAWMGYCRLLVGIGAHCRHQSIKN